MDNGAHMHNNDLDHLRLAFELADDAGLDLCLSCAARGRSDVLGDRSGLGDELSPFAVVAVELLIGEGASCRCRGVSGIVAAPPDAAWRLVVLARVVAAFLPEPMADAVRVEPEFDGNGDHDCFCGLEGDVTGALLMLKRHLAEHDAGDWIDPDVMAGAVDDVDGAAERLADGLVGWASTSCDHSRS